jgi:KUP system potassium uptake protein
VVLFGSSDALGSAYGITVTIDMLITTTMTFFVVRYAWNYPWTVAAAATGFFFLVDFTYFIANVVKVVDGGWFPLLIGAFMFTLMMTWKQGRKLMSKSLRDDAIDLGSFLESVFLSPPTRVPGTAVFLVSDQGLTPNALLHNLKHNKVLHERNLFVTVRHHEVPWIPDRGCAEMKALGNDCWEVTLNFGFKNEPDVPTALKRLREHGCSVDDMDTSYFLSRDIVIPTLGGGMADWREKLFAGMHRNAAAAADFLRLPANRVVELGSKVEI